MAPSSKTGYALQLGRPRLQLLTRMEVINLQQHVSLSASRRRDKAIPMRAIASALAAAGEGSTQACAVIRSTRSAAH